MSVLELVRLALARLAASRLRAALTMLGIVIGVASVIALVAVGQGATSGITAQLQSLGTNLLTVNPGARRRASRAAHAARRRRSRSRTPQPSPPRRRGGDRARVDDVGGGRFRYGQHHDLDRRDDAPTTSRSTTTSSGRVVTDRGARWPRDCASPSSAPRRPTTSGSRPPESGRRSRSTACPSGRRHPPGQGWQRVRQPGRPGPRPARHGEQVLRRIGHGPLDRRQRRVGR